MPVTVTVASVKSTAALAVAAGGAPVHVMSYVNEPAAASVTGIVPESASEPLHPSPFPPPDAVQALAFWEFHVRVTALPSTWLAALAFNVTDGVGTVGSLSASGV